MKAEKTPRFSQEELLSVASPGARLEELTGADRQVYVNCPLHNEERACAEFGFCISGA